MVYFFQHWIELFTPIFKNPLTGKMLSEPITVHRECFTFIHDYGMKSLPMPVAMVHACKRA
jgi:hypothetical protein